MIRRRGHRRALEPNSTKRAGVIDARKRMAPPFQRSIPLPRGRHLATLEDAAKYIQKLPKDEQQLEEWRTAGEGLILVAGTHGPTMIARVGVMWALNRKDDYLRRPLAPGRWPHAAPKA